MYDYVIVGAGFSGAVMAERLANELDKKVLIIEKRSHIGGNAYDRYDESGILIHHYGPHIFHTRVQYVWDYLSRFTKWRSYQHGVLGSIDGRLAPIPFNLNSLHAMFPAEMASKLEDKLVAAFGYDVKVPILKLRQTEDEDIKWLADYVYEKVFLNYTTKQWGMTPEQLDPAVTGRVPVYISRDDRYFQDAFQGIPSQGYTEIFEKMLDHPNITVKLDTDYHDVLTTDWNDKRVHLFGQAFEGKLVFTGKIDELFGYEYGELPYRSLRFEFETLPVPRFQDAGTVNYPNEHDYTRITEFKHLTGQQHPETTIVREYPQAYMKDVEGQNVPYYPIPQPDNQALYEKYRDKAKQFDQLILLGRLADYKYYDMDACVAKALKVFEQQAQASTR
jgi:UDP-galactopyranose mutase